MISLKGFLYKIHLAQRTVDQNGFSSETASSPPQPCSPKCGPCVSIISITWKVVTTAEIQAPARPRPLGQTPQPRRGVCARRIGCRALHPLQKFCSCGVVTPFAFTPGERTSCFSEALGPPCLSERSGKNQHPSNTCLLPEDFPGLRAFLLVALSCSYKHQ